MPTHPSPSCHLSRVPESRRARVTDRREGAHSKPSDRRPPAPGNWGPRSKASTASRRLRTGGRVTSEMAKVLTCLCMHLRDGPCQHAGPD